VTRNYAEKDKDLPTARRRYVKYTYVPGFGFYDIGLLHILGNTTNAATAAWREMLDNGMYANFPGFLISKGGTRQNTNIFRVPPGGGAPIDTGGQPIGQAVMPLPYETAHMAPMMALVQNMVETGQRVGGTSELQVGEGKADAPVGTTLALIDQATKLGNSVHKRLHASQAEEIKMIAEVFKEHPESFWCRGSRAKCAWDEARFMQAVSNYELVPQSDPNTASAAQRVMKVQGLAQLQTLFPALMDPITICSAGIRAIGYSNPEEFLVPPAARAAPPPQLQQMQAQMKNEAAAAQAKVQEAGARETEAKAKAADVQAKIDTGHYTPKGESAAAPPADNTPNAVDVALAQAKIMDSHTHAQEVALKGQELAAEDRARESDAQQKDKQAAIGLAADVIRAPTAGESGKQVSVADAGKKAKRIIRDVDSGLKPK
jgi:hypothetical protein